MNEQEFRESIRKKLTEGMSELEPLIDKFMEIMADAYEKGFWIGLHIGLSIEPKEDKK